MDNNPTVPWSSIGAYIKDRCASKGINYSKLAQDLGVKRAHISRLVLDKVTPAPETCKRLADYFGDSPIITLRAAGWLNEADMGNEEFVQELIKAYATDPSLRLLFDLYLLLGTNEKRESFIKAAMAAWQSK